MKEKTSLDITHELFHIMKQFSRAKLIRGSFEGMVRSEYELLVILRMNLNGDKKALSVSEISNLLQITPAGVTHLVNALEETGHFVRLQAPNDRRIVLIGLTEKGTAVAEAFLTEVHEQLTGLVNYLGEEDSRTLVCLMSRVIEFFAI